MKRKKELEEEKKIKEKADRLLDNIVCNLKLMELKDLLINRSVHNQKEIILDFFYKNINLSKHFENFYKGNKDLFERLPEDSLLLKEYIERTFINQELITEWRSCPPLYNNLHVGTDWSIIESEFDELFEEDKKKD